MNSDVDLPWVAGEAGTVKIDRRKRASVLLPEDEGPERPSKSVFVVEDFEVDDMAEDIDGQGQQSWR
jgi:hypothetical protein